MTIRFRSKAALAALALFTLPLSAQGTGPFTVVETGRSYAQLQQAVDAIGTGRGTIRIAPGTYRQCAVQNAGFVRYEAVTMGKAVFSSTPCEGKAALVLRGVGAQVVGLVFADIRVPDMNGSGIRLEKGNLGVLRSWFRDSEQGILTTNGQNARVNIDRSTFTRLGTCAGGGGCAHSIYIGDYGSLRVTRSRFEQGRGGHYLKSRTAQNVITGNSFDDSKGQATNYMIDLPNGGTGTITGNAFVQGENKENHSIFIAIGAEGARYSSDGLEISSNDARMVPGLTRRPAFIGDWTGDKLVIGNNTLGPGITLLVRR